jgi:hypothetical protein
LLIADWIADCRLPIAGLPIEMPNADLRASISTQQSKINNSAKNQCFSISNQQSKISNSAKNPVGSERDR